MPEEIPSLLVAGDIVVDRHLYAEKPAEPGDGTGLAARLGENVGGARLAVELAERLATLRLKMEIEAGAREKKLAEERSKAAATAGQVETEDEPSVPYTVGSGFKKPSAEQEKQLVQSFGLWQPYAKSKAKKDAETKIWRSQKFLGYEHPQSPAPFSELGALIDSDALARKAPVVLLDDRDFGFRDIENKEAWPSFLHSNDAASKPAHIILKMGPQLLRGDLWVKLRDEFADHLIVVIYAEHLRELDVTVSRSLSWEQTAQDIAFALEKNGPLTTLIDKRCRDVIIAFNSAGAYWVHREPDGHREDWLVFDPQATETGALSFDGGSYGYQSVFCVALADRLLLHHAGAGAAKGAGKAEKTVTGAILAGIKSGLHAKRILPLIGHGGAVPGAPAPGIPFDQLAKEIGREVFSFEGVRLGPFPVKKGTEDSILDPSSKKSWSLLKSGLTSASLPCYRLAMRVARYGPTTLGAIPFAKFGKLSTADRNEIESLSIIREKIQSYVSVTPQKKPLSIAVFGAPGSGKSFGITEIATDILGEDVPILSFNLSQFVGPEELIGAFHQVRDKVLKGITPVVFWDEFDSREYFWLQYLLAPMQDGVFQEGQITHPIGKCVFVFAGGTSNDYKNFGPCREDLPFLDEDPEAIKKFKLLKGPDFVSRLHAFINILGPNPREIFDLKTRQWREPTEEEGKDEKRPEARDLAFPLRRALLLRSLLGLHKDELLEIDRGLLFALLQVPKYRHGSRSFEKIVTPLKQNGTIRRSNLPARVLMDCELDADAFNELLFQGDQLLSCGDDFRSHAMILNLAEEIHEHYRKDYNAPPWDKISEAEKDANIAAARRIPDILDQIALKILPLDGPGEAIPYDELLTRIEGEIDSLARLEHQGWMGERRANGWTYNEVRNNAKKHHNCLVRYDELDEENREKDRSQVRLIPKLLQLLRYKAVKAPDEEFLAKGKSQPT